MNVYSGTTSKTTVGYRLNDIHIALFFYIGTNIYKIII